MFFTTIHQMMTDGVDLTLVIRKANGQLTVSTLPKSNGLKDEAQNHIVPLTVSGLPQELDAGFLQAIARPIQKTAGLITNMAQFEAQAEKAASESKAAKDAKAKETKETKEEKEKREKYEKHFKKAEELIVAKNHKDAVTALGQARLYAKPQDLKRIDEMVAEQKKAMNAGSLFDLMEDSVQEPQVQVQPLQTQARQQPQQAPPYPPQPQMQRPMTGQQQNGQQNPQQQTMWPSQQPHQSPIPARPQYGVQPPMPPQQPQPAYGGQYDAHWQEQSCHQKDMYPYYGQDEPAYRPEDCDEYPDFPQSMLEPRTSHYAQTV